MKLSVEKRTIFGKKVKLMRKKSLIPGIVYGRYLDSPLALVFDRVQLVKVVQKAGGNIPVELKGDGIDELILFHDIQLDPVTDKIIHVDCLAVSKDEKVTTEVPVVLVGEAPFVENNLGNIQLLKTKIVVEALPLDLPNEIKIDVSHLTDAGMSIHISDISLGSKVVFAEDSELTVLSTVAFVEQNEEDTISYDDMDKDTLIALCKESGHKLSGDEDKNSLIELLKSNNNVKEGDLSGGEEEGSNVDKAES